MTVDVTIIKNKNTDTEETYRLAVDAQSYESLIGSLQTIQDVGSDMAKDIIKFLTKTDTSSLEVKHDDFWTDVSAMNQEPPVWTEAETRRLEAEKAGKD